MTGLRIDQKTNTWKCFETITEMVWGKMNNFLKWRTSIHLRLKKQKNIPMG